jgi:hypothetical protein
MIFSLNPQSVLDPRRTLFAPVKFLPQVVFHLIVRLQKVSEKANPYEIYRKNCNHAFLSKPDFEGYRNNAKKGFEENQNYLDGEFHQEPDHPNTFMKIFKQTIRKISAGNYEKC